jgi:hypothetical protein
VQSFQDAFAEHVATGTARQLALGDLLAGRDWRVDIEAGTATFGDDLSYRIQLLGTQSEGDRTWLWAWANTMSNLPPELLRVAGWLREYGRHLGMPELAEPTFSIDRADGHQLALLASGLTGHCYYRGPYPGGALFFQLDGVPPEILGPVSPDRALRVLSEVIQAYSVNHRVAVQSFLAQQGWHMSLSQGIITGRHHSGCSIRVEFDASGRVARIDGELRP